MLAVPFAPIALSPELRAASLDGLAVAECRAEAGTRLPWHAHEHANVVVLLDGSFTEAFRGSTVACTDSMALFKPAAERHANEYGSRGARFLIIELWPTLLEQIHTYGAGVGEIRAVRDAAVLELGTRICRELRELDAYSSLSLAGLVYEMVAVLSRVSRKDTGTAPPWLRRVRDELHADFAHRVSIADLASRASVHPDHLSRSFRHHYGVLIGEYVRRLRLDWSARALTRTDDPLAELALAAGFVDQSEFTRRFRAYYGTTPGRYRKTQRS
jgi:AraC family transcriptional regulator